jgi:hypothetical protein
VVTTSCEPQRAHKAGALYGNMLCEPFSNDYSTIRNV